MEKIEVCPSTLKSGFDTYSPEARRRLFDGRAVSMSLPMSGNIRKRILPRLPA
ncbi:MAG: hypothetical protein IKO75_10385 [Bacteroidales bacterium]|nr:hypothetical protein [Bacteroidales bacterium]